MIDYTQCPERLAWAARTVGLERFRDDAKIISILSGEHLAAVVVYDTWGEADVCMHIASDGTGHWMTREALVKCFAFPFIQCKMRRVTGLVPSKNTRALQFDLKLGFKQEGLFRHAMPDDDIVALGMLREECRWIPRDYR